MKEEFAREIRLSAPSAAVWIALLDFHRVASWIPVVAELREIEPPSRYGAVLADRLGPFTLRADLAVTVDVRDADRRMRVTASGEDRQIASRISVSVDLAVRDEGTGSAVAVDGRYEITGRVATLGAGAVRKKGEHVLEQLFANMERDLGGGGA